MIKVFLEVVPALLVLVLFLMYVSRLIDRKPRGNRIPTSSSHYAAYKRMTEEMLGPPIPPAPDSLIEAHLALRGVSYRWRNDQFMYVLYSMKAENIPVHPDDGYLVLVCHNATLSGWLNACDALKYHHLRRDSEGNIMSPYDIDPNTGQMNVP